MYSPSSPLVPFLFLLTDTNSTHSLLIAVALGVPAAYYFMTKGDTKKAVGDIGGQGHGANQEYKKSAEGNA